MSLEMNKYPGDSGPSPPQHETAQLSPITTVNSAQKFVQLLFAILGGIVGLQEIMGKNV
jgi:hypothetical protein